MEKLTALRGTPFPQGASTDPAALSAELKHMKALQPQEDASTAPEKAADVQISAGAKQADSAPAAAAGRPLDQPEVVSAEQVAHMKPWNPDVLHEAGKASSAGPLPQPSPKEDQPQTLTEADLPHKTPWSTLASQEADQLAHEAALQAAQAEIDAKNKLSLFQKEDTAEDKVAADTAAREAKELERRAEVAEEIAQEQAQWALEQGELRTANHILATDPQLWQTDENTTLPKT